MNLVGKEQKAQTKPLKKNPRPIIKERKSELKNPALRSIVYEHEQAEKLDLVYSENKESFSPAVSSSDLVFDAEAKPTDAEKTNNIPTKSENEQLDKIIAIVPKLINDELETVVRRFKIKPTDENLWKITRAPLESVRPEYSQNFEEYKEKSDKLRKKVILEMTKAAIKLKTDN